MDAETEVVEVGIYTQGHLPLAHSYGVSGCQQSSPPILPSFSNTVHIADDPL